MIIAIFITISYFVNRNNYSEPILVQSTSTLSVATLAPTVPSEELLMLYINEMVLLLDRYTDSRETLASLSEQAELDTAVMFTEPWIGEMRKTLGNFVMIAMEIRNVSAPVEMITYHAYWLNIADEIDMMVVNFSNGINHSDYDSFVAASYNVENLDSLMIQMFDEFERLMQQYD